MLVPDGAEAKAASCNGIFFLLIAKLAQNSQSYPHTEQEGNFPHTCLLATLWNSPRLKHEGYDPMTNSVNVVPACAGLAKKTTFFILLLQGL
jgi:hypothetical protein